MDVNHLFNLQTRPLELWYKRSGDIAKSRPFRAQKHKMPIAKTEKRVLQLLRDHGVLRPRDLDQYGIPRKYLNLLYHKDKIERIERGLYSPKEVEATDYQTLLEVTKGIPNGIICLLSALQFHNLTTQTPPQVWVAIAEKARYPKLPRLPIRVVRFSGKALTEGVDLHQVANTSLKVYSPPKTVADCFKYRNKIGIDVAIEALRECIRGRKGTFDEIWHFAKICRVSTVMEPYLTVVAQGQ